MRPAVPHLFEAQLERLQQMVDAVHFGRRRCGFRCDGEQKALLRKAGPRVILNCSRQSGKSTLTALKAVHCAVWRAGCTIVVTAPVKQQTREFLQKAKVFALRAGVSAGGDKYSVRFRNGSRIVGVAADADTIRGFSSVALVIIDEAARVSDDVYYAMLPMLAVSGGSLWLLSTPKGKRGFFYKEWSSESGLSADGIRWVRLQVMARQCERIPEAFLAEQKRRLGARLFAQEFECLFVELSRGMFDPDMLRKAFRSDIEPLRELE